LRNCTGIFCDKVSDLVQISLRKFVLVQELLGGSIGVLSDIKRQFQRRNTFAYINVKDMVVFNAIIKLLPVLTDCVNNFSNFGPGLFGIRPLIKG